MSDDYGDSSPDDVDEAEEYSKCREPHPTIKGIFCERYGKCTPPFDHMAMIGQAPGRRWVAWPAKGTKKQ